VTIYLKDVPRDAAERSAGLPLVAFSLLQHEHKKSVVHFAIQRNTEYEGSVRSKVSRHLLISVSVVGDSS
jgi:pre-rRNA-processing protein TSR1